MVVSVSVVPEVINSYPEVEIRLVVAHGLGNDQPWREVHERIAAFENRVARGEWWPPTDDDPVISSWHHAYRQFGANPRRSRPSVDALSRRVAKTGKLPRINPAVDAYNLISVDRVIPAGGFDLKTISGRILVRPARPGDLFTPLGEPDVTEFPRPGEIVYADDVRVLTRNWNYRDSDLSKFTAHSRHVIFILERVSAATASHYLATAQGELADLVVGHADRIALALLDSTNPDVTIP